MQEVRSKAAGAALAILGALAAAPPALAVDARDLLARADALWAERADPVKLEDSLALYEQAATADPMRLATFVRLSRGYDFLADQFLAGDRKAREATYGRGADFGERGLRLDPEFRRRVDQGENVWDAAQHLGPPYAEALYWTAVNRIRWAEARGTFTALRTVGKTGKMVAHVLDLDPRTFYAAPNRYFGGFFAMAPAVIGGDLKRAEEHLKRSEALEPRDFATRVLLAEEVAPRKGDRKLFEDELHYVLSATAGVLPDLVPEQEAEQRKARTLLAREKSLF